MARIHSPRGIATVPVAAARWTAPPSTFRLQNLNGAEQLPVDHRRRVDRRRIVRRVLLLLLRRIALGRYVGRLAAFVRFGGLLVATFVGLGGFLFVVALVGRFGRRRLGAAAVTRIAPKPSR